MQRRLHPTAASQLAPTADQPCRATPRPNGSQRGGRQESRSPRPSNTLHESRSLAALLVPPSPPIPGLKTSYGQLSQRDRRRRVTLGFASCDCVCENLVDLLGDIVGCLGNRAPLLILNIDAWGQARGEGLARLSLNSRFMEPFVCPFETCMLYNSKCSEK